MNMEDEHVKDDDEDLPSLPRSIMIEPKQKKGFFNKIKRKKSNSDKSKPEDVAKSLKNPNNEKLKTEEIPKNLKKSNSEKSNPEEKSKSLKNSAVLSEPEEKDEKKQLDGSNSARESLKNVERSIPKPSNNSMHIRKASGSKEEILPEGPSSKETVKKDLKCPIPPSPNSIVKKKSLTKPQVLKIEEASENKEITDTSSTNGTSSTIKNDKSSLSIEKRPISECEENKKHSYSVKEKKKEEQVMQEPKINNKVPPKNNDIDKKLEFDSGSVSSESISRKSSYQNDPFLDEFLANQHMQVSKSEVKINNKPQGKKLTNSLIQLRREEATNYKSDYNSGKACSKCIVI